MKTIINLSINTENQEVSKIGNHSRRQSRLPKDYFSTSKSRKLPIRAENLGNS